LASELSLDDGQKQAVESEVSVAFLRDSNANCVSRAVLQPVRNSLAVLQINFSVVGMITNRITFSSPRTLADCSSGLL